MTWIPETIIRALCWTLLHSLWQGLILAVVAGMVMVLTKRARSATRYAALSTLVLAFLVVSGFTFLREWRGSAAVTGLAPGQLVLGQGTAGQPAIVHPAFAQGVLSAGGEQATPHAVSVMEQLVQYFNTHASAVVVIWFIIFMARFVNLLSGLVYAQRIRHYQTSPAGAEWDERLAALLQRIRISRPVVLMESALIKVPIVVGWLKPAILVPIGMLAQLPAEQVESILLHELAHISRRDYLFNFVQHLIDTLFFFNPALLWVSALIRQERENCCDDVAIRETRSRRKLVQALVSFHEYQQTSHGYVLGFAGERNSLLKRVERIVHKKNHSLNAGERALLMGGVMLLCGAFITINGTVREAGPATHPTQVAMNTVTGDVSLTRGAVAHAQFTGNIPRRKKSNTSSFSETMGIDVLPHEKIDLAEQAQAPLAAKSDTTPPAETATAATWPVSGKMTSADVDEIIKAHEHGVTPDFLAALKRAGYTVSVDEAIDLKDHGVTLEFLTGLKNAGYHVTPRDAIKLVDHGISLEFLQGLQKEGYKHMSIDEAISLVDHGVSTQFIQRVRALGYPDLTTDQAIMLMDHGVSPEFIEKWKNKTGAKLDLRDYIKLQEAGVQPD